MSTASIISGLIFGSVGFVAFVYGKKRGLWRPMVIGAILAGYTFLVTDTLWQYIIGGILTAALFIWRE